MRIMPMHSRFNIRRKSKSARRPIEAVSECPPRPRRRTTELHPKRPIKVVGPLPPASSSSLSGATPKMTDLHPHTNRRLRVQNTPQSEHLIQCPRYLHTLHTPGISMGGDRPAVPSVQGYLNDQGIGTKTAWSCKCSYQSIERCGEAFYGSPTTSA